MDQFLPLHQHICIHENDGKKIIHDELIIYSAMEFIQLEGINQE